MKGTFTANPAVRGHNIELVINVPGDFASKLPGLRVLRQRDNPPNSPTPGLIIFDAQRQFGSAMLPALFARRVRGLSTGAVTDAGMWEFDLWEAHPTVPVANALITHPSDVHVDLWENGVLKSFRLTAVTSAETSSVPLGNDIVTTTTYTTAQSTAKAIVTTTAGELVRKFTWLDTENVAHDAYYQIEEHWQAPLAKTDLGSSQYQATFTWTRDGIDVLSGTVRRGVYLVDGEWRLDVALYDHLPSQLGGTTGIEAETYFYYSLYVDQAPGVLGPVYLAAPTGTAAALATVDHDGPERLYSALPAIHRNYDEPDANIRGNGQLRRFLSTFGTVNDHARSLVDGLALRNDPLRSSMGDMPALAHSIGWDIDRTTPGEVQRSDVLEATEVFETVGTVANLALLIRRAVSWPFEIREFTHNVFVTNGGPNLQWDIWRGYAPLTGAGIFDSAGSKSPGPAGFTGRPACVLGQNQAWLFWHQSSSGRREIWVGWSNSMNDPNFAARPVMVSAPDNGAGIHYTDESPAVIADGAQLRLFWSSNRNGSFSIWSRTLPDTFAGNNDMTLTVGMAEQVTDLPGDARSPAIVREPGPNGRMWLFWASDRRGPSDIWGQSGTWDANVNKWIWGTPRRLTTAVLGDHSPTAAIDANNKVRLFWSSTTRNGARLFGSVLTPNDVWSDPIQAASDDDHDFRDESPCAVKTSAGLLLLWHSNRKGVWQLWYSLQIPNFSWALAKQMNVNFHDVALPDKHMINAKEPAAMVHGGELKVFWRAQQLGEQFTSRTFNSADAAAKAALDTAGDWNHYTYDAEREKDNWYAYDTVGVYLAPPEGMPNLDKELLRIKTFVETYRPATVRIVWFLSMISQP